MPSVLFINRVYPPQEGATGQLPAELASNLADKGWEVTVIASGKPFPEDGYGKLRVLRVGGFAFNRASHLKRAVSYLSLYPKFLFSALRAPAHDVLVTVTDPPLHLLLGVVIKWFKKTRTIHWAQDIYPEVAEELGVLRKGGVAANLLRFVSTFAIKRCEAVVAVGRCMKRRLESRGIPGGKIVVIPNWSLKCDHAMDAGMERVKFRESHNLTGKFVVMYSGNFGLAHPFGPIVDAVKELKSAPLLHFVFIGGGPRYGWVQEQCAGFANVTFLPYQPKQTLNASLGAADVHLACMEQHLEGLVVPSKIYGILAAGKPCLFMGPENSEAAQLIRELDCGWVLQLSQMSQLVSILSAVVKNREPLGAMGQRAESYSQDHNSIAATELFLKLLNRPEPRPGSRPVG